MASSYWDEGIETSIYRLEVVAATTGNADFIKRAKDLETRLKNEWIPVIQGISIKGDALQLGYDLADASGQGTIGPDDPARKNVLYDVDDTLGGAVASPAMEAALGGDIGANAVALGSDLTSSASDVATSVASSASKLATDIGHPLAAKATQLLWILGGLLAVAILLFAYEKGRS